MCVCVRACEEGKRECNDLPGKAERPFATLFIILRSSSPTTVESNSPSTSEGAAGPVCASSMSPLPAVFVIAIVCGAESKVPHNPLFFLSENLFPEEAKARRGLHRPPGRPT